MSINSNDDVNIQDPKAGQVLKYTANGWTNASVSSTSSNACGDLEGYARKDLAETITEPWTWEVESDESGVKIKYQDGQSSKNEETDLSPNRITVSNNNGTGELKVFDSGNTRLRSTTGELSFSDQYVNEVTLSSLIQSCCGTDSGGDTEPTTRYRPYMLNFPSPGTRTFQQGMRAAALDERPEFNDVFSATVAETIQMPYGTDAAIMFVTYGASIMPWSGVTSYTQGYANVGYDLLISANKAIETSPGATLAFGQKLRAEIIGWGDAAGIGGGDEPTRLSRTPGLSNRDNFISRVYFTESTAESPTTVSVRPFVRVHRMRACELGVGSGRVLVLPYKRSDGELFSTLAVTSADEYVDDGVSEPDFDAATNSHDLKALMNYYSTSISETLTYDTGLDPTATTVLEGALATLFDLKRDTTADIDYYYNQLEAIKQVVVPYVGFKFAFEPSNAKATF